MVKKGTVINKIASHYQLIGSSRKRRRLRLPVSHRRTSLPRVRRASLTPTPASTPSLSIDDTTPRFTPTPVRRSRRLARPDDSQQDSDTSVHGKLSPTKSDTSLKHSYPEVDPNKDKLVDRRSSLSKESDTSRKDSSDGLIRGVNVTRRNIGRLESDTSEVNKPISPSKESDTSRKDSSDGLVRGVNVTRKNIRRHESDTSEVDKRTSPSKEESDTSRKDSTSDTRDEIITKRSDQRQNTVTELADKTLKRTSLSKESDIFRSKATSDAKDDNITQPMRLGSDSSEIVENVISYSNYESDASQKSNRSITNINVTRRGLNRYADASEFKKNLSPALNEDSEESRSDSVMGTVKNINVTIRGQKSCAKKHINDEFQLNKRRTSDDSQNKSASDTGDKQENVTIRQNYSERPDAEELTKERNLSSGGSPNDSVLEKRARTTNVTLRNKQMEEKPEDDELVKKLSSLFNEGSETDTIIRDLHVTTRAPKITEHESSTADESKNEKSLLYDKDKNTTIQAKKRVADKENSSENNSISEDDITPVSSERSSNKLKRNLGSLAPRMGRKQAGVVEYGRNANVANTTKTDEDFETPGQSVRVSDKSLGYLAPRRRRGMVEYRRKISSANTTRIDNTLSSQESDDYEQNVGTLAPLRTQPFRHRRGVVEYRRNVEVTTTEIEVQSLEQTEPLRIVGEVSHRARANVDRELFEYEEALRPRRAGVQYRRGGDTPGVPVPPKPKRMRMDSDTDSQDENGGGGLISVRADVHRPPSPQQSSGSLPMSLTPAASDPGQATE
ncbi:dentin sialophosphoprotein-like [Leguminivora glycinivorella]|uniref:dentin sialophosphoprotein-like n=1 Tax=Leguminivora glycinivorella TaxID=1035111 RepID=UPI00200F1352|nr:dentin sialophosphoprotein-like [Leguminivora glycinivorella]